MRVKTTTAAMLGSAFASAAIGTAAISAVIDNSNSTTAQPTRQVDQRVADHFAVLRQKTKTDASAQNSQAATLMADTGVNPELTRPAAKLGTDVTLVTPSKDGLCLGSKETGMLTCGATDDALSGHIVGTITCGRAVPKNKVKVIGAFPDEVTTVQADLSDGTVATYGVTANSLIREFDKASPVPLSFSFTANGAQQRVMTGIPKDGNLGCG